MDSVGGANLVELVKRLGSMIDYYQKKYPDDSCNNMKYSKNNNSDPLKNAFSLSEDFMNISAPIFKIYEDKISQSKEKISKLTQDLKNMEQRSNHLHKENIEKHNELKEIIDKYTELGDQMKSLSSKSFELEKKNTAIEIQYNEARDIINTLERELEISNDTVIEYENKLLELGEKSKIVIHENTELDNKINKLKMKIESKEKELKTISTGKDDIIKILQNRINKLTEDNEILLNNYNNLSDSYKKACISQNNTALLQNQAKSLQFQTLDQEKRINQLMEENLKLEKEIGRVTNENLSLKSEVEELNKDNTVLKEKYHELTGELNSCKSYVSKYENIIEDYKCCLREMNMDDFLNNFPFVLPKVLLNAIRKYKRINSSLDKENRINNMNRNNNYSNKSSSCNGTHNQEIVVNPVDYEIKNLDKIIEKIQQEHDLALRKINQLSYENGV